MISKWFQVNFIGSQTYWIINRSHFYRFQIGKRLSNGWIRIKPHLEPILTIVQNSRISQYFQGQNILWMIKSKVCPCSCDSGEIIGAPDGFTFALIAQQGNVLNQMQINWMSCIRIAWMITLFAYFLLLGTTFETQKKSSKLQNLRHWIQKPKTSCHITFLIHSFTSCFLWVKKTKYAHFCALKELNNPFIKG